MKIKMLSSLAGRAFALSIGDETDQFDDAEAARLIAAGFAEKAAPVPAKKPASKAEWEDERNKLIADRAAEQAEFVAFKAREADLLKSIDELTAFKASVASMVGTTVATETTDAPPAPETR